MSVAVLLSTYNGISYLKKQLDSIIDQSLRDTIHIYARDDGSNDSTVDLLKEYSNKIPMTIIQGNNIGPARSFWELFTDETIKADYYAFCDQDDVWDSDKIERGIKLLEDNKDKQLFCSNCRVIDEQDHVILEKYHNEIPIFTVSSQFVCGAIQGCALVFTDEFRNKIISEKIKVFPMHDFVLVTYAIVNNVIIYDDMPLFSYRIHDKNVIAKMTNDTFRSINASLYRWFGKRYRHVFSDYAKEFYSSNKDKMDVNERMFIKCLAGSRWNPIYRLRVVMSPLCIAQNEKGLRSFKIRTLLGII